MPRFGGKSSPCRQACTWSKPTHAPSFLPRLLLIPLFAGLIAAGAWISVPLYPVPMTMQTFAVLLAGAVPGPRAGAGAVLLYLAAALAGLPILSDGAGRPGPFAGPTAGYLFAFPVAAALVGTAARRGLLRGAAVGFAVLFAAHLLILAIGGLWLASRIGTAEALAVGVTPFLIGAAVKSLLVGLALRLPGLRQTR